MEQIELDTRAQRKSQAWTSQRTKRMTSSNFGTICKATERRDKKTLADSLTIHKDLKAAPILHGQKYEEIAVEKFKKDFDADVSNCGLFVCTDHPMLAASPDGLVGDDCVVEVKCPFSAANKTISATTVPYLYKQDGEYYLKKTHDYYHQVQGQLLCTSRKLCYFVVYTLCDMVVVKIPRDDMFITSMIKALLSFYDSYFKNAVIERFLYHSYFKYSFQLTGQ